MAIEIKPGIDVTHLIERFEAFEDRMGVKIGALYAFHYWANTSDGEVLRLYFDLHPLEGNLLREETDLVVTIYDTAGRLLKKVERTFYVRTFFGFESHSVYVAIPGVIGKIRIIPKAAPA